MAPIVVTIIITIVFIGRGNTIVPLNGVRVHDRHAPPMTPPIIRIINGMYVTVLSSVILTNGFPLYGFHRVEIDSRILYPLVKQILIIIIAVVLVGRLEYIVDSAIRSLE